MPVAYLENSKTKARFRVISFDKETKRGVLVGALGAEFESNMDKAHLEKYHYAVKVYEDGEDPGFEVKQEQAAN